MKSHKNKIWQCIPASFSLATGIPLDTLLAGVHKDGGEIVRTDTINVNMFRGVHTQEILDSLWQHGFGFITVESFPGLSNGFGKDIITYDCYTPEEAQKRMEKYLEEVDRAVIIGRVGNQMGWRHAVAWIDGEMVNPDDGKKGFLPNFQIEEVYIICDVPQPKSKN